MRQAVGIKHKRERQHGSVLIIVALVLPVLVLILALSLDVGLLYDERLRMQTAADAGAYAGAFELGRFGSGPAMQSAVLAATGDNGFSHGIADTDVTVRHPPLSGPATGDGSCVEVTISRLRPTHFWMNGSVPVSARAEGCSGAASQPAYLAE